MAEVDEENTSEHIIQDEQNKRKHEEQTCQTNQEVKKVRLFSAKEFRKRLNSAADRLTAVVEFLGLCSGTHGESVIKEYLQKGGSCLELLQLLEIDPQISHCTILEIVNHVLLQIISFHPQLHQQALEACRYLLNTNLPLINKMLSFASTANERKTILKLLTAFVTFSTTLAREVIQQVNFNPGNLELLTKQTGEKNSVRSLFIKFVVAFLIEGHLPTIMLLLEKKGMLENVIRGLQYDSADTICLITTALKSHVLENPSVSKTIKMKIFNTPVIKEIVNLYNWKGPAGFNLNSKKKKSVEINEYDKSKVSESVHDLLLILCTSHRFGIIFRDHMVGLGKSRLNNLMFTVLDSLEKPWEHSYAAELVLKICRACPDLVKTIWSKLKEGIEPRESENWKNTMKFANDLLLQLDPKCIEYCFAELSVNQAVQVVQILVAPPSIIKALTSESTFASKTVEHTVYLFLSKSLKSLSSYLTFSQKHFNVKQLYDLKNALSNYIFRTFPPVKLILENWCNGTNEKEEKDLTRLNMALDILQFYEKICPQHLETLSQEVDVDVLLNNLYKYLEDFSNEEDIENMRALEIKLVKIFLKLDCSLFKPSKDIFSIALPTTLKYYYETKDHTAKETLKNLFVLTEIFDAADYEIEIWINSIFYGDNLSDSVGILLTESLKDTEKNLNTYMDEIARLETTDELNVRKGLLEVLKDLSDTAEIGTAVCLRHKTFSPLLFGMLNCLSNMIDKDSLKGYVGYLLINLLHVQTTCDTLLRLICNERYKKLLPKYVVKYFQSLEDGGNINSLEKADSNVLLLKQFWVEEDFDSLKIDLHPGFELFLLHMCIFYITNLTKLNLLETHHTHKVLDYMKFVLENTDKENVTKELLRVILGNPMILQYFLPSFTKKQTSQNVCTKFVLNAVRILKTHTNDEDLKISLDPFRQKIITFVMKKLKKPTKMQIKKCDNFMEIIKTFGLNYEHCRTILYHCSQVPETCLITNENTLSFLYDLVVFLLDSYVVLCNQVPKPNSLDRDVITKFSNYLLFLNNNEIKLKLNDFTDAFRRYLNIFPHSYEYVSEELFESILNSADQCTENSLLAASILEHKKEFLALFAKNIANLSDKKGLILALIPAVLLHEVGDDVLKSMYNEVEPLINKALEKPQKTGQNFKKYYNTVLPLIEKFTPISNCEEQFDKIWKFNVLEEFHVKLLCTFFEKLFLNIGSLTAKRVNNFIMTFVNMVTAFVKNKEQSDEDWEKLKNVTNIFVDTIRKTRTYVKMNSLDIQHVSNKEVLRFYCKFCLKYGISGESYLLKNLNALVLLDIFEEGDESIFLEMAMSHSEFLNVILGSDDTIKEELVLLIFILCKKWPHLIQKNYMPITLSAYHATLKRSDRIIFCLLKLYESHFHRSDFYSFKPFLFGPAAAAHYSIRQSIQNALWRQPKVGNVLDILEEPLVLNTIKYFTIDGSLSHDVIDDSKEKELFTYHTNDTYDLAFLLPLFSSLLAPENAVPTYKFTKNGALSLTVLGLCSSDNDVRLAACHVLHRFYCHLEAKPEGRDKIMWIRYVEAVCKGTSVLEDSRLNSFAGTFWAKMALILTQPTHTLYLPMTSYLAAKPTPDLSRIPELYTWLHDSSVNFKELQSYILEILKDGLRTNADFDIALRAVAFKLILELYSSCVTVTEIKLQILEVLESACSTTTGADLLVTSYGLLSWLYSVTRELRQEQRTLVEGILRILNNIVENFPNNASKGKVLDVFLIGLILVEIVSFQLLVCVKDKNLITYLKLLCSCLSKECNYLSEKQLRTVIGYVGDGFCEYLLEKGTKYVIESDRYGNSNEIFRYTRRLTLKWIDVNQN